MDAPSPSHSQLSTTTLMTPELANFSGNVHGGHILRLVDQIAYACAANHCGKYCVTLSVDRVVFKHPVRVGDLLTMHAQVNYTGRTSMQIGVRVEARDLHKGPVRHTNSCFLTMVAMEDGKPSPVPKLEPLTAEDERRWRRAELARDHAAALERVHTQVADFYAIIDLAGVAMLLIDKETGLCRLANKKAVEMLGLPASALINRPLWELHGPDETENLKQAYRQVLDQSFGDPFRFDHVRGDGRKIHVEAVSWVVPLPDRPLIQRVMRQVQ